MKRYFAALAALMLASSAIAQNDVQTTPAINIIGSSDQYYISVRGYAERLVSPDMIYLSIVIDENDTKGKISVDQLEEQMISQLKKAGVNTDKDLKTKDIESILINYRREDSRTIKSYELIVSDAQTLAKVYQNLNEIGVSQIEITELSHSDIENIKREVKAQSVVNARLDALAMSKAIGQDIGIAYNIDSYDQATTYSQARNTMLMSSQSSDNINPKAVELKQITVKANTQVRFFLLTK